MKNYISLLFCLLLSVNHLLADDINYYTLQYNDGVIQNGVLVSVNPNLNESHIYIPDSLHNQAITEINLKDNRGISSLHSVKFSSSLKKNGTTTFIYIELKTLNFSAV